jgi:hypothetical protein
VWDITNDAHSLAGNGHGPRQLDNAEQSRTFAAAHLGLGDPELSTHVGAPIEAPNRAGTGWRKISDAMDCRATNLYTASFPGKAGSSRRYDGLRDRIAGYTARPSEQASSPTELGQGVR